MVWGGVPISDLISCEFCRGCELYIVFRINWITDYGVYFTPELMCWYDVDSYPRNTGYSTLLRAWIYISS